MSHDHKPAEAAMLRSLLADFGDGLQVGRLEHALTRLGRECMTPNTPRPRPRLYRRSKENPS